MLAGEQKKQEEVVQVSRNILEIKIITISKKWFKTYRVGVPRHKGQGYKQENSIYNLPESCSVVCVVVKDRKEATEKIV